TKRGCAAMGAAAVITAAAASGRAQGPVQEPVFAPTSQPILLGAGHTGAVLGLADLNADGWPDAVLSDNVREAGSGRSHRFTVILNPGDGQFSPPVVTPLPKSASMPYAAMALGDFDEDGSADVVTSLQFPPRGGVYPNLSVLFGTPGGRFVNQL